MSMPGGVTCLTLEPSGCRVVFVGPATFTGTMYGDAWYEMSGWTTSDGLARYEGPDYMRGGGIEGCGTGNFIIDDYDGWVDFTKFDPATNTAPGYNRWRIRPGSGTGDLAGVLSGEGENHWRIHFDETGTSRWGQGVFTGTITCDVPAG